jgi:hypothetical protein
LEEFLEDFTDLQFIVNDKNICLLFHESLAFICGAMITPICQVCYPP